MPLKYVTTKRRDGGGRSSSATYDYINRLCESQEDEEVLSQGSNNMPSWAITDQAFWSAADSYERQNGSSCEHVVIPLPAELELKASIKAVEEFCASHLKDVPSSWAIHRGENHNPHVHIIHSRRSISLTEPKNMKVWNSKSKTAKVQFFKRNGAKKDKWLTQKAGLSQAHKTWVECANKQLHKNQQIDPRTKRERKDTEYNYLPQWRMNRARKNGRLHNSSYTKEVLIEKQQFKLVKRTQKNAERSPSSKEHRPPTGGYEGCNGFLETHRGKQIAEFSRVLEEEYRDPERWGKTLSISKFETDKCGERLRESIGGFTESIRLHIQLTRDHCSWASRACEKARGTCEETEHTSHRNFEYKKRVERIVEIVRKRRESIPVRAFRRLYRSACELISAIRSYRRPFRHRIPLNVVKNPSPSKPREISF